MGGSITRQTDAENGSPSDTSLLEKRPSPASSEEEAPTKTVEQLEAAMKSNHLMHLLFAIGQDQTRTECIIHRGISCNTCNANPLTGIRYKCANCLDYDVCARCEPICDHDNTHVFLKITVPLPPLVNPRSTLLSPFYPGKNVQPPKVTWTEILELRKHCSFNHLEIEFLYEQFKSLSTDIKGITKDVFNYSLGPLSVRKNILVDQLFLLYDQNGDGYISFFEFAKGLFILTRGSHKEKAKHFFKAYDIDGDNYISKDDMLKVLQAHHQISVELVRDIVKSCEEEMLAGFEDTGNRPISAIFNAPIPQSSQHASNSSARIKTHPEEENYKSCFDNQTETGASSAVEAMTQDALQELMEDIFKTADTDKDGKISLNEFNNYLLIDPSPMTWLEAIGPVF